MSLNDFITTYPSIAGASFGSLVGFLTTVFWTFCNEHNQKKAVRKILKLEIDNNLVQIKAIVTAFESKLDSLAKETKQEVCTTNIYSPALFNNLYIQKTAYERLIVEMSRALSEKEIQKVFIFYGTLDLFKRDWSQLVQNDKSLSKDILATQMQQLKLLMDEENEGGNPLTKRQPKFFN